MLRAPGSEPPTFDVDGNLSEELFAGNADRDGDVSRRSGTGPHRAGSGGALPSRRCAPLNLAGDVQVEYRYDLLGQRIERRRYTRSGGAWTLAETTRYVWGGAGAGPAESVGPVSNRSGGWLLLMELNGSNETVKRYTWGLDLAGQTGAGSVGVSPAIEGAGGIGGLLAVEDLDNGAEANDPEGSFLFCYDGNGNVGQLVRWSDFGPGEYGGSGQPATPTEWHSSRLVAKYEYDPYGALIGPDADQDGVFDPNTDLTAIARANPLRFSTKQWDDATGLGYWGERYYSAKLGRWMSRDPIEERGGRNPLVAVANSVTVRRTASSK